MQTQLNTEANDSRNDDVQRMKFRSWGFRRHYPTGIKMGTDILMICTKCGHQYGRHDGPLPKRTSDGTFEGCTSMKTRRRCMNTEYELLQKIELEAMPIGETPAMLRINRKKNV